MNWGVGGKKCSFQRSRSLKPYTRIFAAWVPGCLILAQCTAFLFPPTSLYVPLPPSALTYYLVSNMNTLLFRSFSSMLPRLCLASYCHAIESCCSAGWVWVLTRSGLLGCTPSSQACPNPKLLLAMFSFDLRFMLTTLAQFTISLQLLIQLWEWQLLL